MFCTNGVLLRMLTHGEGLAGVTHIIVDEIHERDRFADFLLILVRRLLPAHPGLRVLLMSATLHTELFSGYFGGCPIVRVCRNSNPIPTLSLSRTPRRATALSPRPWLRACCSAAALAELASGRLCSRGRARARVHPLCQHGGRHCAPGG